MLELLEPYVERYFGCLERVWRERPGEMAQNIVIGLYPTELVSPGVVQRTDRYLTEADPHPSLRRLLLEERDGIVRALRAQERDAAG